MATKNSAYYIIAAKLVNDPDYVYRILELDDRKREKVFALTLREGGLDPQYAKSLSVDLNVEFNSFVDVHGYQDILAASKEYLVEGNATTMAI